MLMTKRAKKRLGFLLAVGILVVGGGILARVLQNSRKDEVAKVARVEGLAAVSVGDWETALTKLSMAVTRYPQDAEAMVNFANARSRVPAENGQHLQSALKLFVKAEDLCRMTNASNDLLIESLLGRGRIELAFGQIARLEGSSRELLKVDPGNLAALEQLQMISISTGDFIAPEGIVFVRGQRTNDEWLEDLREAQDASALRWSLERLAVEPDSNQRFIDVIQVLNAGKSVEAQQARSGATKERPQDLLRAWVAEGSLEPMLAEILIINELLKGNSLEEAQTAFSDLAFDEIEDPRILLLAADLTVSVRGKNVFVASQQLLEKAMDAAGSDPEIAIEVAIRYWNMAQIAKCLQILRNAGEMVGESLSVEVNSAILAILSGDEELDSWIQRFENLLSSSGISAAEYDRIQAVAMAIKIQAQEQKDVTEVRLLCGNFGAWLGDPLVLCLLGDVARDAGLNGLAVRGYRAASSSIGGISIPISNRLIAALGAEGSFIEAFRVANSVAASSQTAQGVLVLCQAWIDLAQIGIKPQEIDTRFAGYSKPSELILALKTEMEAGGGETGFLEPLVVRAYLVQGERAAASETLERLLSSPIDEVIAKRLVTIALNQGVLLSESTLRILEQDKEDSAFVDDVILLSASRMRATNGPADTLSYLRTAFRERDDSVANRAIGVAILELAMNQAEAEDGSEGFDRILSLDLTPADLRNFMRTAVRLKNREKAAALVTRAREIFGAGTQETSLAEGTFVLAFDSSNEESIVNAIGRIDPVVSAGEDGSEIVAVLARLLRIGTESNLARSIEVLQDSTGRHPESWDNAALLFEYLLEAERNSEAEEIGAVIFQRRNRGTLKQKARLASLFSRQGRLNETAILICELASATGDPEDLFRCFQMQMQLGKIDEADQILDDLAARGLEISEIEVAIARRYLRRGEPEESVEFLRNTTAFDSEVDREVAVATILMELKDWEGAVKALRSIGDQLRGSGEAQLLLAISLLEKPIRDVAASKAALDRVVELCGDQPGFLRRVASIAMNDPDLRDNARPYIDLLGEVAADQAEVMRLADAFYRLPAGAMVPSDMEERGRRIAGRSDAPTLSWVLYLDILTSEFNQARSRGEIDEVDRLAELLQKESIEFSSRFPNSSVPGNRQSRVMLLLGDPAEAALLARGALNKIEREVVLGDVQLLARAEFLVGNYDLVINSLAPFRDAIEENPESRPASWELLFASLLLDGQVEIARDLYVARETSGENETAWLGWLSISEKATAEVAIEAASIVLSATSDMNDKLLVIGVLSNVFRQTNDDSLLKKAEVVIAEVEREVTSEVLLFRLKAAKVELAAATEEAEAIRKARDVFIQIDPAIFNMLERRGSLEGSEREIADAYFVPVCVFLNNFVARAADIVIAGEASPGVAASALEKCDEAGILLAKLLPDNLDVLDTRARLKLALGQFDEAIDLARIATNRSPASAAFQLTVAEILLAQGDVGGAENAAKLALRLARLQAASDEQLVKKITEVIEKCQARVRHVLKTELEILV